MATKSKALKTPKTKIEKYEDTLKVILTPEEIADRADRAAQLIAERDNKEEEQKAAAKRAKSVIESMDGQIRHLSNEVRTRSTYRKVECERRYLYSEGLLQEIRLDTHEVILDRKLTDREMQRDLYEDAAPAESPNGDGDMGEGD